LPNFFFEGDGSKKFSGIADNDIVMGFQAETLPGITAELKIVVGAHVS
jgi:uncharacterized protein (DUF169 family)